MEIVKKLPVVFQPVTVGGLLATTYIIGKLRVAGEGMVELLVYQPLFNFNRVRAVMENLDKS